MNSPAGTDFVVGLAAAVIILVVTLIAVGLLIAVLKGRRSARSLRKRNEELLALHNDGQQLDQRFLYLFNNTTDSVYSFDFEPPMPIDLPVDEQVRRSLAAKLTRCNAAFAQVLGANSSKDIVGRRLGSLDSSKDTQVHTAYFTTFVQNDYSLTDYELNFVEFTGKKCAVRITLSGVLQNRCLERVWAIESNVIDLREAKAELERRQLFQELVATVSSKLLKASDIEANSVVEECLLSIRLFMGADRCGIYWRDGDGDSISLTHYSSEENKPFGQFVPDDIFPIFTEQLKSSQVIRVDDVNQLADKFASEREFLIKTKVKAFAVLPMIVAGEVVGGMSISHIHFCTTWSDQDMRDLSVFAELLANFVLRMQSTSALSGALQGLQSATDRLEAENVYLREAIESPHGFAEIIGQSDAILRSLQLVEQVADTRTPVLLLGETGTGKELVARAIHDLSDRRERPLVKVNCAALPANLIESELFGHEVGAFTGADRARKGRFDLANGSTLFLDEIAEIPIELQAKLLRVLQEGEYERLGGTKTIRVDVRILAATNRNIHAAVRDGEFRSDLFYRINTFPIELPPLRDRDDDVQLLASHFTNLHATRLNRNVCEISSEMMRQLRAYRWPGNIRELEGIIQRALISSSGAVLELAEPLVPVPFDDGLPRIISSSISALHLVERDHIVTVLEDKRWKISGQKGAAAQLGIPPSTLRSKMKKLGIIRPD